MRTVLVLALVVLGGIAGPARADDTATIALLPLDADAKLEIYGQPVASEVARAMVAGGLDVIVVGPKMAVPERARLIVDGSVKRHGDAVVLGLRLRNPVDGTVLQTLEEKATTLANIDQAAARLSARVLPIVREQLVALARSSQHGTVTDVGPRPMPTPAPRQVLVGIGVGRKATRAVEPLRAAMTSAIDSWTKAAQRVAVPVDASTLVPSLATQTLASRHVDRAIAFEVLALSITRTDDKTPIPLARARVRVRIAGPGGVAFDRVIVTDTVVGERGMTDDALAERAAREVLAILRPHLRRVEPSWR